MVENISNYTTTIICTIMMTVIIKMIVPNGKNKKYVLFICGMITTITILEPLIKIMNLDINEVLAKNEMKYEEYKADDSLYKNTINESYENVLIEDITNRLKENGYSISNVRVEYSDDYMINKIYLNLEDEDGYVQPVKIEVSNNQSDSRVSDITKNKIQNILKENYGVEKDNIIIERSN